MARQLMATIMARPGYVHDYGAPIKWAYFNTPPRRSRRDDASTRKTQNTNTHARTVKTQIDSSGCKTGRLRAPRFVPADMIGAAIWATWRPRAGVTQAIQRAPAQLQNHRLQRLQNQRTECGCANIVTNFQNLLGCSAPRLTAEHLNFSPTSSHANVIGVEGTSTSEGGASPRRVARQPRPTQAP